MTITQIKSPLPGVFYQRPSPDDPPFKDTGDKVAVGDVIGLVEVMKMFHEVTSDVAGTFVAYRIENEATLSPGQTIAEVKA